MKQILVPVKICGGELNPFDGSALECALAQGCAVTVLSMAPPAAAGVLENLTRLGAQGVQICDSAFAGSDTQATARILEAAVRLLQPDLIFCGRQSVDGDTGQVPAMLAERLKLPLLTGVMDLRGDCALLRGGAEAPLPARGVVAFEKSKTLRFPSLFSVKKELRVLTNRELNVPPDLCGLHGSPTQVIRTHESTVGRRFCRFAAYEELDRLIREGLARTRAEHRELPRERLPAIRYVGAAEPIARLLADRAEELAPEGKTLNELEAEVRAGGARTILFDDRRDHKELAARLAVRLGAGLCADCTGFTPQNGRLVFTRPAMGGAVTADIICNSEFAMATARTAAEPGAEIVFGVGMGALHYLESIRALAAQYGAELCATRLAADSGRMPYSAQVGLTGRVIAPKVYVAFGISGAVQHTCAIERTGTVIAVNCDKNARIFDYADFGLIKEL